MPTYDYECRGCGHQFEKFQSIKADHIKTCPKCEKDEAKRLIGGGLGIIFKGSGYYCTDNKKSGTITSNTSTASSKKNEAKPANSSSKTESSAKSEVKTS